MKAGLLKIGLLTAAIVSPFSCAKPVAALRSVHGQTVDHWLTQLKRPESEARIAAIKALQSVGAASPDAIPAVAGALSDSDPKVRDAAALALLNIGPPAAIAIDALDKAKNDHDLTVRSHVQLALRRISQSD